MKNALTNRAIPMNERALLENLSSSDVEQVLSTLSRLGSDISNVPSPLIFDKILDLISNTDPDVRHEAIFACGVHWHYPLALPKILEVLRNEQEDQLVLTCAATAVGSIAHEHKIVRQHAVSELAKVVSNENFPQDVRNIAYTSALWANCQITPDEYAKRSVLDTLSDVDWGWLAANTQ